MEADKDAFLDKLFGNRHEEHEGRVAEFEKHLAEVRAERLEERKKKRVAERRQTYINQLREQKKKEREEQQRREKVWKLSSPTSLCHDAPSRIPPAPLANSICKEFSRNQKYYSAFFRTLLLL